MNPLLTIFTLTTDVSDYVDETIRTVPRDDKAIEHFIVHDGNTQFTEALASRYPWLRIFQGSGTGPTAAGAVAIARASGEFVFELNSDDRLLPGSIEALAKAASSQPDIEVWTGGTRIFTHDDALGDATVRILDDPAITGLTLQNVLDDLPLLTARFVRRQVYETLGSWSENFPSCSDREFVIRMALAGTREAPLGVRVSELRMHIGSGSMGNLENTVPPYLREHLILATRYFSDPRLPHSKRLQFRNWYAREALRKFYHESRLRCGREAWNTLRTAFQRDPLWLWHARSAFRANRMRYRTG